MLLFQLSSLLWRMSEAATQSCSVKKSALENFAKLTGNHLCQILLFNKVVGIRSVTLLKKRLRHRVFPVNFVKFSRIFFFLEHLLRLLLVHQPYTTILLRFSIKFNVYVSTYLIHPWKIILLLSKTFKWTFLQISEKAFSQ